MARPPLTRKDLHDIKKLEIINNQIDHIYEMVINQSKTSNNKIYYCPLLMYIPETIECLKSIFPDSIIIQKTIIYDYDGKIYDCDIYPSIIKDDEDKYECIMIDWS
jgi:hypothetical protein